MKKSLKSKLTLSYLAVALITVLVVSVLIRLTSGQSLMNLVVEEQTAMLNEAAVTYYTTNGTMIGFQDYYSQLSQFQKGGPQPDSLNKPPQSHEIRGVNGLVDTDYKALIPMPGIEVGQVVSGDQLKNKTAVEVDGKTVAWILPDTSFQFKLSNEEQVFLKRTNVALAWAAGAGVLVAVVMGILLASGLLKPIRRLTKASQALSKGDLKQQVPVTSNDELGQLTTTFNQMSSDLARADEQRKQMTADITHDLSTPLQIISGYIEMLEDGEVTLSPERIEIIKTEIDHLRRLVGDLSTLTQVETGALDIQLQPVQTSSLLERVFQAYQPIAAHQGVEIMVETAEPTSTILVDEGRMLQVLKNLVDNALRYTPRGGTITLIERTNEKVNLYVSDSGSGIDAEDLPYVFDRFYRADKSRNGTSGKMGLGLAICKALVTAQGGEIHAESAGKGQGTTMVLSFPAA